MFDENSAVVLQMRVLRQIVEDERDVRVAAVDRERLADRIAVAEVALAPICGSRRPTSGPCERGLRIAVEDLVREDLEDVRIGDVDVVPVIALVAALDEAVSAAT